MDGGHAQRGEAIRHEANRLAGAVYAGAGLDQSAVDAALARMTGDLAWTDEYHALRRLSAVADACARNQRRVWQAVRCWDMARQSAAARRWLVDRAGVDWAAVADLFVGVARVDTFADGSWQLVDAPPGAEGPSRSGEGESRAVVTVPVFDWRPRQVGGVWRDGFAVQLADLVAIDPAAPAKRWRALAAATALQRTPADFIAGVRPHWGARVRLYQLPIDWLRASAPAGSACVLDWQDWYPRELLCLLDAGTVEVTVDGADYRKWLAAQARPPRPKLRLVVAGEAGH